MFETPGVVYLDRLDIPEIPLRYEMTNYLKQAYDEVMALLRLDRPYSVRGMRADRIVGAARQNGYHMIFIIAADDIVVPTS